MLLYAICSQLVQDRSGSLLYVSKRQMGALMQQRVQQRVEAVSAGCETDDGAAALDERHGPV